jgi:hypothetical protein
MKYYARDIGVVKETDVHTGEESLLVEFTLPGE